MNTISAAITLLLVMDPFGNVPVFLALLRTYSGRRRRVIIVRELLIALGVLLLFLFFGRYILSAMHISEPALAIAGGVILFFIAVRMVFPGANRSTTTPESEPMIVPLAVPLVAGPSAMATVILFSTQAPERLLHWLLALVSAWAVSFVILFFSDSLHRVVGNRGLNALERLMGMILTTMAVQMLLDGISKFVRGM